ncbi:hypothetical protein COLO4_27414 [Corchorus olitorius]|uniref:Protein kinase domain-containing protein n=1 Tax=Corchorus olitorius TaxID=93759 RepID=A0A1R3HRI7_9ROSI|nr:hypothetical protein COLO4_27414 [Corchorus olitorius]
MEAPNNQAGNLSVQAFNFREIAAATKNFRQECLIGEGGFGKVYRGTFQATGKVVAVKQLDRHSMQENKEFLVEVGQANPPVIYRDLKSLNVLLDDEMNVKLSDIGLSKLGPSADKMPMQSRVMGTYGYSAPEYSRSGKLTTTADVYSFGVVLLELITGRKAIDTTKPVDEQNLVTWAQPKFKEPKKFPDMADPLLKKQFPERGLNQAVAIAAMCLQEESAARPLMSDVVTALSFLSIATEENSIPRTLPASISSKLHCISTKLQKQFMEPGTEGKLIKKEESSVQDGDSSSESESESDDDQNNEEQDQQEARSVCSSRSSSVSRDENGAVTHDYSRKYSTVSTYSREESNKDSNACSGEEASRSAHYTSDYLSCKYSKDASFSSCLKDSNHSSRKSIEGNVSRKSSKKSKDENVSLHQTSSRKSPASTSRKSSQRAQDGNVSFHHNSSNKSSEGNVSRKSSKKSQHGNLTSDHNSSRISNDEINPSPSSSRKNRRRHKKVDDSHSSSSDESDDGSQTFELESHVHHNQNQPTFTKASTVSF